MPPTHLLPPKKTVARISAIVLAAGRSTRMGTPKPLIKIEGRPMLGHVLETLRQTRVHEVVVVLGHEAVRVTREVAMEGAVVVTNPDYAAGMSTSIQRGLTAADPKAQAFLLVLGDQPFVSNATIDTLILRWRPRGASIVIPTFRGRRGNPVLVARSLSTRIDAISGDVGFRALFQEQSHEIVEVPVDDPGVLFDVDTPTQLRSFADGLKRGNSTKDVLTDLVMKEENPSGPAPPRGR